jgi:hypothetical protein
MVSNSICNIHRISDINVNNLNIKKPIIYCRNETVLFDIYYRNESLLLDVQGYQICCKKKHITFVDCVGETIKQLEHLFNSIIERVKSNSKYKEYFEKKEVYRMIDGNMITFKNICEYDTVVFDMLKNKIDMVRLKLHDNVRLLIYVKNLWVNDKYFGINIKLSQIQRIEPMGLNICLSKNTNIPLPPKPPQIFVKKSVKQNLNPKNNEIVRPSLNDILKSRGNLRKTNLLS